jgi:hypothetical protein
LFAALRLVVPEHRNKKKEAFNEIVKEERTRVAVPADAGFLSTEDYLSFVVFPLRQ